MVDEKRLDSLQDEIKLLKAEVKNSLASVRDYLLNMELPSSEFSTILAALAGEDANPQKMNVDSNVSDNQGDGIPKPEYAPENMEDGLPDGPGQPGEYEDLLDFEESGNEDEAQGTTPEGSSLYQDDNELAKDSTPLQTEQEPETIPDENMLDEEGDIPEDTLLPEDELDEEESEEPEEEPVEPEDDISVQDENDEESELPLEEVQPMEYNETNTEVNQGIPKVNMLSNLINWVARAKQEIGYERLSAFLEVYGVSGHLSPELKEVIIHLAEIAKDLPDSATDAEIWSESMLSLHGILTGGDAPTNPVIPSWVDTADESELSDEEEIIEIDKAKAKQAKLKLVLPSGNGKSKEFCIDLSSDQDDDSK
jgi:hypothetical protein